jgi:hypothetical protein
MGKREFVQLAHNYNPKRHAIGGNYASVKWDGVRGYWDGGITRGLWKDEVPWANTEKDARYKERQRATGLWSRYGHVIHAPDWWLDGLPGMPIGGELHNLEPGKAAQQFVVSTVKQLVPDSRWRDISFVGFEIPPYEIMFSDGVINNTHYHKTFTNILPWIEDRIKIITLAYRPKPEITHHQQRYILSKYHNNILHYDAHVRLQDSTDAAHQMVVDWLESLAKTDHEGLVIQKPFATWLPERVHNMLKFKCLAKDAEATVIGYITGRKTDKGSKLLGKMGALILRMPSGCTFELSGFSDDERRLGITPGCNCDESAEAWATENPETEVPDRFEAVTFPRGTLVTYRYRTLSRDGIPQEARYWRKRDDRF